MKYAKPIFRTTLLLSVAWAAGGCNQNNLKSDQTIGCVAHDHDVVVARASDDEHAHETEHASFKPAETQDDASCDDHELGEEHGEASEADNAQGDDHEHGATCEEEHAEPVCDADHTDDEGEAFELPASAQRLLGMSFVTARPRHVVGTVRFPGRFELMPDARRSYGAALPGVVEIHVRPPQRVASGELLFTLRAPDWVKLTGEILDAEAALALINAEAAALRKRLTKLRDAGSRNADLEQQLVVKEAEFTRAKRILQNATAARRAVLALGQETNGLLRITAREAGRVERVPAVSGAWVETGAEVASIVRSERLWFRADGIPAALTAVRDGQTGFVEPLTQASDQPHATKGDNPPVTGHIELGLATDDAARIHPVYLLPPSLPTWAAPGRVGVLSVVIEESAPKQIALPEACVVTDGLRQVVFVRDPHDAERLLKRTVLCGTSDGDWVAVEGLAAGEAVVLDGAYELKLMVPSSGVSQRAAGHFHADGQFHEGEH